MVHEDARLVNNFTFYHGDDHLGFWCLVGNASVNPTQRVKFFFLKTFFYYFFFFLELAYDRKGCNRHCIDDYIVWGACQAANHSPERPTYGRLMAGSYGSFTDVATSYYQLV